MESSRIIMKDKAISIDLNTNVEVGEENIIVPGDKASFRKKNVEKYKGLLSNMTADSGTGWMTTTNKKISLVSDEGGTAILDIDGKRYSIDSSLKLIGSHSYSPTIAGDITSVTSDGTNVYYIIRDKLNEVYLVKHSLNNSFRDVETLLGTGDSKSFEAFFLAGSTNYAVSTVDSTHIYFTVYDIDGNELISQTAVTTTYAMRTFNNGWWQDSSNYAVGRDDNDQYYARTYAVYSGTARNYLYQGCIDEKGNITGEPVPVASVSGLDITYYTPTRLSNGVLKWERWSRTNNDGPNPNATSLVFRHITKSKMNPKDTSEWATLSPTNKFAYTRPVGHEDESIKFIQNEKCNIWVMMITPTVVRSVTRNTPTSQSDGYYVWEYNTRWIVTDPGFDLGILKIDYGDSSTWTEGEFESLYPVQYIYTNKQGNRGKTFVYGKGFIRSYVINGGVVTMRIANSSWAAPSNFYNYSSACYIYECYNGSSARVRYLDAWNNQRNQKIFDQDIPVPVKSGGTSSTIDDFCDSTMYVGNIRLHPITAEQIDSGTWNEWLWSIGGNNVGNNAFLSDIPFYVPYSNFTVLGYSGYTIGFSYNKVLINTPAKEIESWSHLTIDGKEIIATTENVYILGQGEFKLRKIADYIFATNCISEWNTLQESREGNIKLIRGFIPYNMIFELNNNWRLQSFLCPEDGGSANATWLTGAAVNANLSDDYLAASFLLPAIEIPIYVASADLAKFDSKIVDGNMPLLVPRTGLLFSDEELQVYYTYSQLSTDIVYRYTIKGSDTYYNPDYEDNSWWITSTTIFMPIGIAAKLSGINYLSSTVSLEGDYTVRLHVQNNQAYTVYNIAEQVYYGGTIFTIYTNNYYYDGEAIYSIVQGSNAEFVCYAIGLRFLGNSGTEAYFYSPYDKSIYLFSGSNTLSKTRSLSDMGNIVDSMFSSVNQRMYLLDDNSKVLWLSNESSGLYELANIDHLESSEKGAIFVGNGNYTIYSPRGDFSELVPVDIETSWIGDNTSLQKFNFATIQLYSDSPVNAKLQMLFKIKDGTDITEQLKTVEINKSDWKGTFLRLRASPENAIGQAFKFIVKSNDLIRIMNIEFAFEQISNMPAPSVTEIAV